MESTQRPFTLPCGCCTRALDAGFTGGVVNLCLDHVANAPTGHNDIDVIPGTLGTSGVPCGDGRSLNKFQGPSSGQTPRSGVPVSYHDERKEL